MVKYLLTNAIFVPCFPLFFVIDLKRFLILMLLNNA